MQRKPPHIIQRQIVELNAVSSGSTGSALTWERKAAQFASAIVAPCLEECFGQLAAEEHWVIGRLEVDLGTFSPQNFEKEARHRLATLLREHLGRLYTDAHKNLQQKETRCATEDNTKREYGDDRHSPEEENVLFPGPEGALYKAFVSFLYLGRFPWWYDTRAASTPAEIRFSSEWVRSLSLAEKETLKRAVRTSTGACTRITNHFSPAWISYFMQHTGMAGDVAIKHWHILSPALASFPERHTLFHQNFWTAWITAAGNPEQIHWESVIAQTADRRAELQATLTKAMLKACRQNVTHANHAGYARALLERLERPDKNNRLQAPEGPTSPATVPGNSLQRTEDNVKPGKNGTAEAAGEEAGTAWHEKKNLQKEEDAFFVEAAGLVLLHPFLTELFTTTGLWKDAAWQHEQAVFRAVQLVSFLSFGETNMPEHRLLFHKILTGTDPEAALPAGTPLSREEEKVCNELLRAVITHWKALRNTGPDGLREAFLQRQGKLTQADNGYRLTVESKPQDVLLSRLPWGCGIIKLPWMPRALHVSWL